MPSVSALLMENEPVRKVFNTWSFMVLFQARSSHVIQYRAATNIKERVEFSRDQWEAA